MPNIPEAQKSFWTHSMVPPCDEAQVQVCFGLLDIVLILTQDRCTVCVERTIGLEIILDTPDGTPRVTWVMWNLTSFHLKTVLVSGQDRCTICAKRTIGLEIILDAPDGTTR